MTNQYALNGYENERGYKDALNDELVPYIHYYVQRIDDASPIADFVNKNIAQRICDQMNKFCRDHGQPNQYEVVRT